MFPPLAKARLPADNQGTGQASLIRCRRVQRAVRGRNHGPFCSSPWAALDAAAAGFRCVNDRT
jgi:hypothetical protein